jgi:hypothetical protein
MKVLITNIVLEGRTGTEIVTIELARGLAGRGHQVAVFAPYVGSSASSLLEAGITVTHRIEALPWKPDIIHGQHNIAVAAALARYPDVPSIFVMHDAKQDLNGPIATRQIVRLFAVDKLNRAVYSSDASIEPKRVDLLLNCVDLDTFSARDSLPERPRRALLLTKNQEHVTAVREAARISGLLLDEIGPAFGNVVDDLHVRLKHYDIVFATARMALEALAVGCAVVVCDGRGFAGLVTSTVVDDWRNNNFGLKLLRRAPTVDAILTEIKHYDANDAAVVSSQIRKTASLAGCLTRLESIYQDVLSNWTCSSDDQRRHSEALGDFLAAWVHRRSYPMISGDITVAASERDVILNSRSALVRRLWQVTKKKLRRY